MLHSSRSLPLSTACTSRVQPSCLLSTHPLTILLLVLEQLGPQLLVALLVVRF